MSKLHSSRNVPPQEAIESAAARSVKLRGMMDGLVSKFEGEGRLSREEWLELLALKTVGVPCDLDMNVRYKKGVTHLAVRESVRFQCTPEEIGNATKSVYQGDTQDGGHVSNGDVKEFFAKLKEEYYPLRKANLSGTPTKEAVLRQYAIEGILGAEGLLDVRPAVQCEVSKLKRWQEVAVPTEARYEFSAHEIAARALAIEKEL